MTTRAFQKIYTRIDNITKATVTLRAQGVGNDELATVGGKLAQVVKIMGENVTLQVFAGQLFCLRRLHKERRETAVKGFRHSRSGSDHFGIGRCRRKAD